MHFIHFIGIMMERGTPTGSSMWSGQAPAQNMGTKSRCYFQTSASGKPGPPQVGKMIAQEHLKQLQGPVFNVLWGSR